MVVPVRTLRTSQGGGRADLDVAWTFAAIPAIWCGMKWVRAESAAGRKESMNILLIIIGVVAVVLLLTGGFVQSLNFLLWVGIVLAVIALIVWLVRMISGRRAVSIAGGTPERPHYGRHERVRRRSGARTRSEAIRRDRCRTDLAAGHVAS